MSSSHAAPRISATIPELVERARALAERGSRTILGIVGSPGAGKTTLCTAIESALGDDVVVVGMDGFHLDNPILIERGRREDKGAPDTFDVAGYLSLLRRLGEATEPITYGPRFDREIETSIGSAIPVPQTVPLVITEGLYLLREEEGWEEVRGLVNEMWYLELPDAVRQDRLLRRRLGHGDNEEHARDWVMRVDQASADRVAKTKHRADLIIEVLDNQEQA